jgi:hypothetical protein
VRDARSHFQTELLQMLCHQLRGPRFAIRQLRMPMNVPPPLDDFGLDRASELIELRLIDGRRICRARAHEQRASRGRDENGGRAAQR